MGKKGYQTVKLLEHNDFETLLKHKVIKNGTRYSGTKLFHFHDFTVGEKGLDSIAAHDH